MRSSFANRHIGPWDHSRQELLDAIGYDSLASLVDKVVPESIQWTGSPDLPAALSEDAALASLREKLSSLDAHKMFC